MAGGGKLLVEFVEGGLEGVAAGEFGAVLGFGFDLAGLGFLFLGGPVFDFLFETGDGGGEAGFQGGVLGARHLGFHVADFVGLAGAALLDAGELGLGLVEALGGDIEGRLLELQPVEEDLGALDGEADGGEVLAEEADFVEEELGIGGRLGRGAGGETEQEAGQFHLYSIKYFVNTRDRISGMAFGGMRVLGLESRRSAELGELIRRQGGEPFVAPSLREVPVEEQGEVFRFAERLFAGEFEMMILLTGVGTKQLNRVLAGKFGESALADALRRVAVAARGPKPVAALREMGITPAVVAPAPNTWRELMQALEGRTERRVALQEYGRSNPELLEALAARGCEVTRVRVYQYGLPLDTGPLREAARRLAAGGFDAALFTTAVQIEHLAQAAREEGVEEQALEALRRCLVASIGPTTSEALEEFGIRPALEPSQPKMGILVKEAAERAGR